MRSVLARWLAWTGFLVLPSTVASCKLSDLSPQRATEGRIPIDGSLRSAAIEAGVGSQGVLDG